MLGLLILSGGFSGTETALFSLKTADLNRIRRAKGPVFGAIAALRADLPGFLTTVLFGNMVVNILLFATSAVIAAHLADEFGAGAGLAFNLASLLMVITFGEVTPKALAAVLQLPFARLTALPMYALHRCLSPLRRVLNSIVKLGERLANVAEPSSAAQAEELHLLMQASREQGVISSNEHELIAGVVGLAEVRMREILTPRMDVIYTPATATCGELLDLAREKGHSKIPLRDLRNDEFVGWVDARELFIAGVGEAPAAAFLKEPCFVSEFDRADEVLDKFLDTQERLAFVVDEWGSTVGIVTLWDVISEIFGEIADEDETRHDPMRDLGGGVYLLDGRVSVREWRGLFGVVVALPRAATMGGLVTALLGRSARVGDRISLGKIELTVEEVLRRRPTRLRLTLRGRGEAA